MPRVHQSAPSRDAAGIDFPGMERPLSVRDMIRITAGAVTSLVIVGWLVFFMIALLSTR